jgi:hypothetical protein
MLALALAAQTVSPPPQAVTIDWPALPPIPYRAPALLTDDMHGFVHREALARHCPLAATEGDTQLLVADVAILVDANGNIAKAVPRAIDCPTVEQYAAGLVAGFARNNLLPRVGTGDQWYKTSITFSWKK